MEKETYLDKVNRRGWYEVRRRLHNRLYLLSYRSYWHYLLNRENNANSNKTCYYAARPNIGAGIGHQMANWIAGYHYAKLFGLKFAHIPFVQDKWDKFLGFGRNEDAFYRLKKSGYKVRRLPIFDIQSGMYLDLNKKIIASYSGTKTILLATQDQFLRDLYLESDSIIDKFYNAPSRKDDKLEYFKDNFNIAIHVRRVVVIDGKTIIENEAAHKLRWLSNDYYETVLKQVLDNLHVDKPISIWIFSTGKAEEFKSFSKYGDIHFCNDMDEYRSFAHLVFADLLITSKSSFSYKPALMNKGIKVCPRNFWHGYPGTKDWILCDNDGTINDKEIDKLK